MSLWYLLPCDRDQPLVVDAGELHGARWWSRNELAAVDPALLDPHFPRFLRKISD